MSKQIQIGSHDVHYIDHRLILDIVDLTGRVNGRSAEGWGVMCGHVSTAIQRITGYVLVMEDVWPGQIEDEPAYRRDRMMVIT